MTFTAWPFFGLRVRTPSVELRIPSDEDLFALADQAAEGVHAEDFMPFNVPWTRGEPDEVRRNVLQWNWRQRAELKPEKWCLDFVVVVDGQVIGTQGVQSEDFAVRRVAETGSWIGRRHQGKGIGKEMRTAALHLIFEGLGAVAARSGAWADNARSVGVSRAVGYADNGTDIRSRDGKPTEHLEFLMRRAEWETRRRGDITIDGLDPCLPLLAGDSATPESADL